MTEEEDDDMGNKAEYVAWLVERRGSTARQDPPVAPPPQPVAQLTACGSSENSPSTRSGGESAEPPPAAAAPPLLSPVGYGSGGEGSPHHKYPPRGRPPSAPDGASDAATQAQSPSHTKMVARNFNSTIQSLPEEQEDFTRNQTGQSSGTGGGSVVAVPEGPESSSSDGSVIDHGSADAGSQQSDPFGGAQWAAAAAADGSFATRASSGGGELGRPLGSPGAPPAPISSSTNTQQMRSSLADSAISAATKPAASGSVRGLSLESPAESRPTPMQAEPPRGQELLPPVGTHRAVPSLEWVEATGIARTDICTLSPAAVAPAVRWGSGGVQSPTTVSDRDAFLRRPLDDGSLSRNSRPRVSMAPPRPPMLTPRTSARSPQHARQMSRGHELRPAHQRVESVDWRETGLTGVSPSHQDPAVPPGMPAAAAVPPGTPDASSQHTGSPKSVAALPSPSSAAGQERVLKLPVSTAAAAGAPPADPAPARAPAPAPAPAPAAPAAAPAAAAAAPAPAAAAAAPAAAAAAAAPAPAAQGAPAADKPPPSRRDAFNWIKVLGYGASCKVLLAEHQKTGIKYAVKVVSKAEAIGNEMILAWLRNERDILQQCNHPNIIKLFEIFTTPTELFYVLEYAEGGELLEYIKKGCRFTAPVIRSITAEIILALEYLAKLGIVHRDLKPENILLDGRNHVKLVDFGTATIPKRVGDGTKREVALPGMGTDRGQTFCGTYQYLSPELLAGERATHMSDIWATGCVVYQMACGCRPFEMRAVGGLMGLFDTIRHPEQLKYPEKFPPDAQNFCQQVLVCNPAKRLGAPERGGFKALKSHRLFTGINWDTISSQELKYDLRTLLPLFLKDTDALDCYQCNAEFTFWNRRHHCRKCGQIFCKRCSNHSVCIRDLYGDRKVRVCDSCFRKMRNAGMASRDYSCTSIDSMA
eukprot:TRINITY_DN6277_c0_g1_i1.p1 TRINITY_DN6277_c0_g1~~TRINITY_DN6277_c0_g1_i1.p1  ORF type:complete len:1045 (+),score=228.11 TRINITY_DN6277_c0_g1_i1:354-3137(+)